MTLSVATDSVLPKLHFGLLWICSTTNPKGVLCLALDWQRIGQRLFRLWHTATASLYCRHMTSG